VNYKAKSHFFGIIAPMAKKKYYVVWVGATPGIYETWAECQAQIKGYPNARYKSFSSKEEALEAYGQSAKGHIGNKVKPTKNQPVSKNKDGVIWDSIAVDAACSGNPGLMEYRGVDTSSGEEIFRVGPVKYGTNNIGEFLALVHGLAYLQKIDKPDLPIYSDSKIAMGWVRRKHCKTTLVRNAATQKLHNLISRAEQWLKNNTYRNPILKWETSRWGEIPADFGRK
jgi:ribonuclease HI